ncbi:uncharacterized protein LOC132200977 isoform X2 [Neocloeon triangulifer]|nr:uncharacterized protein LOC132200977 isoform X2 [Neocloeon triangulifer]
MLREVVISQEDELLRIRDQHKTNQESMDNLWKDVMREAKYLIRREEDLYHEHLMKLVQAYANQELFDANLVQQRVLAQLKKHVDKVAGQQKGPGGSQVLQSLKNDVKKFSGSFVASNLPLSVRQWFVYFPSEIESLVKYEANNKVLLEFVLKNLWVSPPSNELPYSLSKPHKEDGSDGLVLQFIQIFENKKDGIFIECGAGDGESSSSTLYLERRMGWKGVLVEASPDNFAQLVTKNRKSALVPACISPNIKPTIGRYNLKGPGPFMLDLSAPQKNSSKSETLFCIPLHSIYLTLNKPTVDLLSLHTGGGTEFDILKSVPWQSVNINVVSISVAQLQNKIEEIKSFMKNASYLIYSGHGSIHEKEKLIFKKEIKNKNQLT